MRVEQLNNIASQSELDAYAAHLRNLSMYTGETIEAATALFPGWGVDDVTAITLPEISAICKETAWSMELKVGGTMKHPLERVVLALG